MAAPAATPQRWLFGPLPDLLLGCGGLYLLAFGTFALAGGGPRLSQPPVLAPLLILMFSMPHYAATLLRVYENRADRHRYALFTVYFTVVMLGVFVAGLHAPLLGVFLVTLYLTWSPWHYTGQNYGISLMFLGRRGIGVPPDLKRWIYASFVLSFALTFLVMHEAYGGDSAGTFSYLTGVSADGAVRFQPLGIPRAVTNVLVPLVGLAYLGTLVMAGRGLLQHASARELLPTALLAVTQAAWFTLPFACRFAGVSLGVDPLDPAHRTHYFLFIAVGHAVQYLWVSSYYARRSPRWNGSARYFGKTILVGWAVWNLPLVLFAPWALGSLSYDAGLFLVLSAAVNLHHFVLDGAIWKLRDSRVGSTLLRGESHTAPALGEGTPWLRRGVWAVAGVGAVLAVGFFVVQQQFRTQMREARWLEAERSLDLLAWTGADSARARVQIALGLEGQGKSGLALEELRRSLAIQSTPRAHAEMGRILAERKEWERAELHYAEALELAPASPAILHASGVTLLQLDQPERARERFERALELRPDHAVIRRSLDEANRRIQARAAEG